MPQRLRTIPLVLLTGERKLATATGNNAAWNCICGWNLPLVGKSGAVKGVAANTRIDCPKCKRRFFVVPDGYNQAKALEVKQVG